MFFNTKIAKVAKLRVAFLLLVYIGYEIKELSFFLMKINCCN